MVGPFPQGRGSCQHGQRLLRWTNLKGQKWSMGILCILTHTIHGTGIFTFIWLFLMVKYGFHVGKYTIHGFYGLNMKTIEYICTHINLSIAIYICICISLIIIYAHMKIQPFMQWKKTHVNMDPVGLGCLPVNENQQNKIPWFLSVDNLTGFSASSD